MYRHKAEICAGMGFIYFFILYPTWLHRISDHYRLLLQMSYLTSQCKGDLTPKLQQCYPLLVLSCSENIVLMDLVWTNILPTV